MLSHLWFLWCSHCAPVLSQFQTQEEGVALNNYCFVSFRYKFVQLIWVIFTQPVAFLSEYIEREIESLFSKSTLAVFATKYACAPKEFHRWPHQVVTDRKCNSPKLMLQLLTIPEFQNINKWTTNSEFWFEQKRCLFSQERCQHDHCPSYLCDNPPWLRFLLLDDQYQNPNMNNKDHLAPFFNRPAPNENFGILDSKPASPESKPAWRIQRLWITCDHWHWGLFL